MKFIHLSKFKNITIEKLRTVQKTSIFQKLTNYYSLPPISIQLSPSDICNYNCIMCPIHSPKINKNDNPYVRNSVFLTKKEKIMTEKLFKKIIPQLKKLQIKNINLVGSGEPFLNPKIIRLIFLIKKSGLNCFISSNGVLLDKEKINKLIDLNVDGIMISVHSPNLKTYLKIHPNAQKDDFHKVCKNINLISTIKQELKSEKPMLSIDFVISRLNYRKILTMVKFSKKIKAERIAFIPLWTFREIEDLSLTKKQFDYLKKIRHEVKRVCQKNGIQETYDYLLSKLELFILNKTYPTRKIFLQKGCQIGYDFFIIHADGRLMPCCGCNLEMGNLNYKTIQKIWNSQKYRLFRKILANKKPVKNCECLSCDHLTLE